MTSALTREQVLGYRARVQQVYRERGTVEDTEILNLGVQDTGPDGGLWALALRGVDISALDADLATVWTVRGAPHLYRRADLPGVAAATAPFSEDDASRRIFDAAKPLHAAGITTMQALDQVADAMRQIVRSPTVKGDVSAGLTAALPAPFLRECRPCGATHVYEQPFRLAALRAGLELAPGTSPPVLRRIPKQFRASSVPDRLDVVRGYLHCFGAATHQQVAEFLDAPLADVRAHWPRDVAEVVVEGKQRWVLAGDLEEVARQTPTSGTRLLGPFDLFLQARDRELIAPDAALRVTLWPRLGRPGAVLQGSEIVGTWRPRKSGKRLSVQVTLADGVSSAVRDGIGEQAQRLAAFRGLNSVTVGVDRP